MLHFKRCRGEHRVSRAGVDSHGTTCNRHDCERYVYREVCCYDAEVFVMHVRGPGKRGGAEVTITDCAIYDTKVGVRAKDKIEKLKMTRLAYGQGVSEQIKFVNGKATSGYENVGEQEAPALEVLLQRGFLRGKE